MANGTQKTKYTVQQAVDGCTRRESDNSDEDVSDAESFVSNVDSVAEDMFLDGLDVNHDKETDPVTQDSGAAIRPTEETETVTAETASTEESTLSDSEWEPETGPSSATTTRGRGRGRGRARGAGRGGGGRDRRRGAAAAIIPEVVGPWHGVEEPDTQPTQPIFRPLRSPGCQLVSTLNYSVLQLFQLFFTNSILQTIIRNTNEHGRATQNTPSQPWKNITINDMFSYLAIVIYMGFVKATSLTDYWRKGRLYTFLFPKSVITGKRFLSISRALHLSSAKDDRANEEKRGTPGFDRLGKIKPLYVEIRKACQSNYQPGQHIAIDERMVASKARVLFRQYMKNKPVRCGFKLFVLADSISGYTWDFFVYEGKSKEHTGLGLSYDSVMSLTDTSLLGTGYKLYVDNFYTGPTLFRDLLKKKIWACGTIRTNTIGFPKTTENALDSKSPRGTIKWIRDDPLLFVQWRDTRDVSLCSTLHAAHDNETIQRKIKDKQGHWSISEVPIPPVVRDYNKHMGGVDLSDALIGYYEVLHKTKKWYKTFFYHFLDIAIVNAFILYKELCKQKGQVPMHQKAFRETLALELSDAGSQQAPQPQQPQQKKHHRPTYLSGDSTTGRIRCKECHSKTPIKCATCDVALCFQPSRDCYNKWHEDKNM